MQLGNTARQADQGPNGNEKGRRPTIDSDYGNAFR